MKQAIMLTLVLCGTAHAENVCKFDKNTLSVAGAAASLVVQLENPPRTKVVLGIDGIGGFNRELVWDPAVGDGLQHDLLLPRGEYRLMAFADDDRVQTSQMLVTTSLRFFVVEDPKARASIRSSEEGAGRISSAITILGSRIRTLVIGTDKRPEFVPYTPVPTEDQKQSQKQGGKPPTRDLDKARSDDAFVDSADNPRLVLICDDGRVDLASLQLDTKELQAGSVARGFLDQTAPSVVTDTLSLIAEIAVERAKSGAMSLVRERFVDPICRELNLQLLRLGNQDELAFPRACSMLRNMHVEDLLSSGRGLLEAARDDVRMALLPRVIAKLEMPPMARDVAQLALRLGNEMLEGGGAESAALDLIVSQMERIMRLGVANDIVEVKKAFVDGALNALLDTGCGADAACQAEQLRRRCALILAVFQRFLPADPGELLSQYAATEEQQELAKDLLMSQAPACARKHDTPRTYVPADRKKCLEELAVVWAKRVDWQTALVEKYLETHDERLALIETVRAKIKATGYDDWLQTNISTIVTTVEATVDKESLKNACAMRVAIGVLKWCSGRDKCTVSDIAMAMSTPENLFAPPKNEASLENLCWERLPILAPLFEVQPTLRLPAARGPYVELATRALAFLTPAAKGEERQRVLAVLRWMFDVAKVVESKDGDASFVQKLEEVVELFAQRAYVRALTQTVSLSLEARGCKTDECIPESLQRAIKLLGAVGSYLQVYDDTRDKDAAEAKAARKKAIENLIDVSTDRRERAGDRIFSFGIPVGLTMGSRWAPASQNVTTIHSSFYRLYERDNTFMWRLPLALAVQRMPGARSVGWHLALTFADLGNFVRGDANGEGDDIAWKDFVHVGVQGGITFGNGQHMLVVAGDVSWSPGLYERDVMVTRPDGTPEVFRRSGALLLGVTLAYYVPLFDLN